MASAALLPASCLSHKQQQKLPASFALSTSSAFPLPLPRGRSLGRGLVLHSQDARDGFMDAPPWALPLRQRPVMVSSAASAAPAPTSDSAAPSPPVSDVVWPAAGAFVAMLAMSYIDKLIEPMGLTFTIAPFGAVCAVLFATPTTPAAKKYNMFVAHVGCAAMGILALALFGQGWLARGTALAASIAFMQLTGSMHPPAAGLPLLFIDAPKFRQLQLWYLIFPSAVGCILLCLLQEVVLFLRRSCKF